MAEPGPVRGMSTLSEATLTRVEPTPTARFRVICDRLSGEALPTSAIQAKKARRSQIRRSGQNSTDICYLNYLKITLLQLQPPRAPRGLTIRGLMHSLREAFSIVYRVSITYAQRGLYLSIYLKTTKDLGRRKDSTASRLLQQVLEFSLRLEGNIILLTLIVYLLYSILYYILSTLQLVALSISSFLLDLALVIMSLKIILVIPSYVLDSFRVVKL